MKKISSMICVLLVLVFTGCVRDDSSTITGTVVDTKEIGRFPGRLFLWKGRA